MANQLDGSKRSNQIYELDSIRYLREEDAADIFGLPYSTVLYFAQAAGAVYQLKNAGGSFVTTTEGRLGLELEVKPNAKK